MQENIIGKKINNFTVIGDSGERKGKRKLKLWEVQCVCGKRVRLIRFCIGKYKSCGCKRIEAQRKRCYKGYEDLSLSLWNSTKRSARLREIPFLITIKQGWELFVRQGKRCALSGETLAFSTRSNTFDGTASLDRIDSSRGYTIDNVQWVHKDVNYMKTDLSEKDFLTWCRKIVRFNKTKPTKTTN